MKEKLSSQLAHKLNDWLNEHIYSIKYLFLYIIYILIFNIFLYVVIFNHINMLFTIGLHIQIFLILVFTFVCFVITSKVNIKEKEMSFEKEMYPHYKKMYLIGLIPTLLLVCLLFYTASKEVSSKVYNSLDKQYIHSELSDNKITVFESFIIGNRYYSDLRKYEKQIEKELEEKELEARKEAKEKLLK